MWFEVYHYYTVCGWISMFAQWVIHYELWDELSFNRSFKDDTSELYRSFWLGHWPSNSISIIIKLSFDFCCQVKNPFISTIGEINNFIKISIQSLSTIIQWTFHFIYYETSKKSDIIWASAQSKSLPEIDRGLMSKPGRSSKSLSMPS